jgi:hypothetical protein
VTAKIQIRRDTISNWGSASPTANLSAGEIGVAFSASGDVHGVKIGPSGGGNWNSLPYLNGTLPDIDVSGITSWNDNALRTTGRFIITSDFASNGPSGSIAFVADDGRITCMSVAFGSSHLHIVTTEGNSAATPTAVPAKMLFRIYDGNAATPAWRDWTPLSLWSSSATTGVDVTAKSLTLTNATNAVSVPDGTVAAPSITNTGDVDTGVYFPAADSLGIALNGANAILAETTGVKVNVSPTLALAAAANVMRMNDLSAMSAISIVVMERNSAGSVTGASGLDGNITWGCTNFMTASPQVLTASSGNWYGIAIRYDVTGGFYETIGITTVAHGSASSSWTLGLGTDINTVLVIALRKFT